MMNYFDIAKRITQEYQAENLKKLEARKCISCGVRDIDPHSPSQCLECHMEEMLMLEAMLRG